MFGGFLVFTHVMRRPCWCIKQGQNVLKFCIKFPKDVFAIFLYTNMAAVTSHENQEYAGKFALPNRLG